ncbi:MAG: hypothetical protein WAQ52_04935, partial [Terriglobales bacterium]
RATNRSPKSADGRMAAEAVCSGKVRTQPKSLLTLTGLLMEGVYTSYPDNERNGDVSQQRSWGSYGVR